MATLERFDVLVDGSVGSNIPAFCECFREWPTRPENVDEEGETAVVGRKANPFRGVVSLGEWVLATERAAETAVWTEGLEKFWRLAVLPLLWEVKLA